jgi:sulfate/thiosulfate transport system permease protein
MELAPGAPRPVGATAARRRWRPSRLEIAVLAYLALAGAVPLAAASLQLARMAPAEVWRAITAPAALAAIALSIEVALVAAVLNAPLGLLVAWVLERYRFPGRRVLDALVDLPLAIPGVVAGISFMSLFGPTGHVGRVIGAAFEPGGLLGWSGLDAPRLAGSRTGLVLAGLYVTLPFVVRTVQPVVATLDREAEEAAEVLGASTGQRFWKVILPQLTPAVVAAFGLAFARSVNEYGVAVLVSGNVAFETLVGPVYVYQRVEAFDYGGATAVAAVLLTLCLAVLGGTHAYQRRSTRRAG